MATTPTSLSRLAEEWPGWSSWFESRPGLPEVLRILDVDRIRVEEYHEGGTVVVRAELPGIDPDEDIEVTIDDGSLVIQARREREEKTEEEGRFRSEFHYGSFMRRVPLPPGATEESIEATYHDGILEVRVPVQEEAAPSPTKVAVKRT